MANYLKQIKLVLLTFVISAFTTFSQENYSHLIENERAEFEQELLHSKEVLKADEIQNIKELQYFPIDSSWVLTAKFKKKIGKEFEMPTTTSRKPKYRRVGYLYFEYNGKKFKLTAYQNIGMKGTEHENYIFLPFKDGNAPELTYGGGRYLDVEFSLEDKEVVIDFNKAYNPYCVYSHRYSCPITPAENHIPIKVNAGVKNPITIK